MYDQMRARSQEAITPELMDRSVMDTFVRRHLPRAVAECLQQLQVRGIRVDEALALSKKVNSVNDIQLLANAMKTLPDRQANYLSNELSDLVESRKTNQQRAMQVQQQIATLTPPTTGATAGESAVSTAASSAVFDRQTVNMYHSMYALAVTRSIEQLRLQKITWNSLSQISEKVESVDDIQHLVTGFKFLYESLPAK